MRSASPVWQMSSFFFFFEKRGSRLNSTSCKNGSNALATAEDHIAFTNIRHLLNSLHAHKKNCCLHSVAKLTFDYLQRLNFSGSKNRCRQMLKIFQRALGFKFIAYLFTLTSSKAVWAASFSENWRSQNRQCDKNERRGRHLFLKKNKEMKRDAVKTKIHQLSYWMRIANFCHISRR